MKTFLLSALFTVCLLLTSPFATAQTAPTGIVVENIITGISDETLNVSFTLKATDLRINCDGHLKLEISIENDNNRMILPAVIYSGNLRYKYERRNAVLSGALELLSPYHIYRGVKSKETYTLDYRLIIPYYAWMEHAQITLRQYMHDCAGEYLVDNRLLVGEIEPTPGNNVQLQVVDSEETVNPHLFRYLAGFLMPEVEEVKTRDSMIELHIGFPVNVTEVRPAFGNNRHELQRADSLINLLYNNPHVNINGITIHGYASPEGQFDANERLAKGRSESFKRYMLNTYPGNEYLINAKTDWTPEDWEGLARLINAYDLPHKEEVLAVALDASMAPDTKDQVLQKITRWSYVYKPILNDMYPKLRRIELRVNFVARQMEDSVARKLIYTNPDMLSQEEIYRVAQYYQPGSREYSEIYRIAAAQFPGDVIANNNAAAAYLQEGDAESAWPYLLKIEGQPSSHINFGAYYYIMGNIAKAIDYFNKAKEAGVEQAHHNLMLISNSN